MSGSLSRTASLAGSVPGPYLGIDPGAASVAAGSGSLAHISSLVAPHSFSPQDVNSSCDPTRHFVARVSPTLARHESRNEF